MHIYPAIDLLRGSCVRLLRGQFDQATVYHKNPLHIAGAFGREGAQWLHVVDLEASRSGQAVEKESVLNLIRHSGLKIQLGGGIRTFDTARWWLEQGVDRIVIGSAVIEDPCTVKKIIETYGPKRCILALDVMETPIGAPSENNGLHSWTPMTRGWTVKHDGPGLLTKILGDYLSWGGQLLLSTDVSRDGALLGPALELYQELSCTFPDLFIIASGGIKSLEDLATLQQLGLHGAIVGKALYEKKFTISQALTYLDKKNLTDELVSPEYGVRPHA